MRADSYAFLAIAVVASLLAVIAFLFYSMNFVGIAPFIFALMLVAAGVSGCLLTLPKKNKAKKKSVKKKKGKKGEEAADTQEA
ncbi:MAG: hypothetical protein IKE65_02875 [Clostridia bacterium]|nr:hypothetical protein [Clostridia bacterium]